MINIKSEAEILLSWKKSEKTPLVSICCITYNHEEYIEQAIRGFLSQETEFPYEIVIHDDASTDKTQSIIKHFQEKYPRIIRLIVQKENQYSKGKNIFEILLPEARAPYIALCEGDDYWISPIKLRYQLDTLKANPDTAISIHNARIYNEQDRTSKPFNSNTLPRRLKTRDVLTRRWFAPTASFFFEKTRISQEELKCAHRDIELLFLLSLKGEIDYTHETFSVYRYLSTGSLSAQSRNKKTDLFRHKINFLSTADNITGNRFRLFTNLARARAFLALTNSLVRSYFRRDA